MTPDFPDNLDGKESACNAGDPTSIPGLGRFPTYFSILACRIPLTEGPHGLHSMGSQRVGHNRMFNAFTFTDLVNRREGPEVDT